MEAALLTKDCFYLIVCGTYANFDCVITNSSWEIAFLDACVNTSISCIAVESVYRGIAVSFHNNHYGLL